MMMPIATGHHRWGKGAGMTQQDQYFLGYRGAEQQRLQEQALQLADESSLMFDRLALAPGARVLEIGCGPQGCLGLLSERVGPSGEVVGVERSEEAVALAKEFVRDQGLTNVEIIHGDARSTGLPRQSFDAVTSRLVLVNVPHPKQIVDEAFSLAKPGGVVAFHEADYVAHICDPPLEAWGRAIEMLNAYSMSAGIDLFIGRKLPRMLRTAGLADVQAHPLIHIYASGHGRRPILLDFVENLSTRLVETGAASQTELQTVKQSLERHLNDPDTLVLSHLFIQAWGHKP
jgi:ubiquinone/menaquinone biosynthesis C-methylase UbiE